MNHNFISSPNAIPSIMSASQANISASTIALYIYVSVKYLLRIRTNRTLTRSLMIRRVYLYDVVSNTTEMHVTTRCTLHSPIHRYFCDQVQQAVSYGRTRSHSDTMPDRT